MKRLVILAVLMISFSGLLSAQSTLTTSVTPRSVTLTWTASTTTGVNYHVYRAVVTGTTTGSFKLISTFTGIKYTDYLVIPGTTYVYQVTAFCPAKGCQAGFEIGVDSIPSNQATVTVPKRQ